MAGHGIGTNVLWFYAAPFTQFENLVNAYPTKISVFAIFLTVLTWYITNVHFGHKTFFSSPNLKFDCDFQALRFLLAEIPKIFVSSSSQCTTPSHPASISLHSLSHEILDQILVYLKPADLVCAVSIASRFFYQKVENESLWHQRFKDFDTLKMLKSTHNELFHKLIFQGTASFGDHVLLYNRAIEKLLPEHSWKHNFFLKLHLQPTEILRCFSKWGRLVVRIHFDVYDLTEFANEHPGGDSILREYAGGNATKEFAHFAHSSAAQNMMKQFMIYSSFSILGKRGTIMTMTRLVAEYQQ